MYAGELPSCPSSQARFRLLTYTFVESGIPPILCYSGHAVTLLGHLLPAAPNGSDSGETKAELTFRDLPYPDRHHLIGQAVQLYYAHNDAYGPFDRIRIFSDEKAEQIKEDLKNQHPDIKNDIEKIPCIISQGRLDKNLGSAFALVVGLPRYVQNTPETVFRQAIYDFDKEFPSLEDKYRVYWRCLLVETSQFKRSLLQSERNYPITIRNKYASTHFPRYSWLIEFSICLKEDVNIIGKRRVIDGEFLYDTSTPRVPICITQRIAYLFRDLRKGNQFQKIGNDLGPRPCFVLKE